MLQRFLFLRGKRAGNRVFSGFLILTFLLLPSVSVKIFTTFACDEFDGDYGSFLKADYSIDCGSDEHALFWWYAVAMIFCYPIGIPLMYYGLLRKVKHLLDPGQMDGRVIADTEELRLEKALEIRKSNENNPSLKRLAFLYQAYEPWCWWFEIVETLRKLALTGGLLFLKPGTASQIIIAMFMCLGAIRIYAGYAPFIDEFPDYLSEVAQWQLFFTMFAALAMKVNVDGENVEDKQMFDWALALLQLGCPAMVLCYAFLGMGKTCLKNRRKKKFEERNFIERTKENAEKEVEMNKLTGGVYEEIIVGSGEAQAVKAEAKSSAIIPAAEASAAL